MGYIENNLAKDEKIMARIKHSWAGMITEVLRFIVLLSISIVTFYIKTIVEKIVGASLDSIILNVFTYFMGTLFLIIDLIVFMDA
ncbi:MAG: hypothetical protein K2J61_04585, partial [Clostridia bacterium]|nr:hypothetical protein [Clostridia bacterium]